MSPRDLSIQTVEARLLLLSEALQDLELAGDLSAEQLSAERLHRRAVERILCQLVDLAVDINQHVASSLTDRASTEYRQTFDAVARLGVITPELATALKPSVGLRNVLTHEYVQIELGLVSAAIPLARTHYREYVRQVARWVKTR